MLSPRNYNLMRKKSKHCLLLSKNKLQDELKTSKFNALLGNDDADDEFFESSLNLQ